MKDSIQEDMVFPNANPNSNEDHKPTWLLALANSPGLPGNKCLSETVASHVEQEDN